MKIQKIYLLLLSLFLTGMMLSAQENQITLTETTRIEDGDEQPFSKETFEYDEDDQLILNERFTWNEGQNRYVKEIRILYTYDVLNGQLSQEEFEYIDSNGVVYYSGTYSYTYYDNGCTQTEMITAASYDEEPRFEEWYFYGEQTCKLDSFLLYNLDTNGQWKLLDKTEYEYNDSGLIRHYYRFYQNSWLYKGKTIVEFNEAGSPTWVWTNYSDFAEEEARSYDYDEYQNVTLGKYLVKQDSQATLTLRMDVQNDYTYNANGQILKKVSQTTDYNSFTGEPMVYRPVITEFIYYCNGLIKSGQWNDLANKYYRKKYYYQQGIDCGEESAYDLFLYPNPATSQLTISSESLLQANSHIRIFDAKGTLMYSEVVKERIDRRELAVGQLPAGVYFVQIGEGRAKRFVKQ